MNKSKIFTSSTTKKFSRGGRPKGRRPNSYKVSSVFDNLVVPDLAEKSIEDYVTGFEEKERQKREINRLLNFKTGSKEHFNNVIKNYFQILDKKAIDHPMLSEKNSLQYVKKCVKNIASRNSMLFCIDVEAFEFQQDLVTEVGIAIYDPSSQVSSIQPNIIQIHIIIEEYEFKKNGKFVPDNKDNFLGGESLIMKAFDAVVFIQLLINYYFIKLPLLTGMDCLLLGHGLKGDITWLNKMGVKFPQNHKTIDTQKLWGASHGTDGNSLSRILRFLNVPHAYLHNAGNDAFFTTLLCLNLCDPHTRLMNQLDDPVIDQIDVEEVEEDEEDEDSTNDLNKKRVGDIIMVEEDQPKKPRRRNRNFETVQNVIISSASEAIRHVYDRKEFM